MKKFLYTFLPLLMTFWAGSIVAQGRLVISHSELSPKLDGVLDDPVWQSIQPVEMISLNPVSGQTPFQPTQVRIFFTSKHLYAGAWMFDNEPSKIRASNQKRDNMDLSNDWFCLCLDSYLDKENALVFCTPPSGSRTEFQIINDGQGTAPYKVDWNVDWTVKTSIDSLGWYVEMQIPLSSLRYQVTNGNVRMGYSFVRYISRKDEWDTYPLMSNEWGFWSWAKPSRFPLMELSGIKSINPLYFSPYIIGGLQYNPILNPDSSGYLSDFKFARNAGLDVKYGIAKNLTLDLTLNTDFAQVEADDQKINLTRFSLFFPEKRQFFLERSSVFDVNFGGNGYDQIFYSRRIGIYEGQQVPVWGGGRLTGRVGDWDIGALTLQTGFLKDGETGEEILPSINNSVVRLRRKIPVNNNSYIGGISTLKIDPSGNFNWNYGLDAIINTTRNDYLKVIYAQTLDSDDTPLFITPKSAKYYIDYERRRYERLSYDLNLTRAGYRYLPELGFETRQDFTSFGAQTGYGWILADKPGFIQKDKISIKGTGYIRNDDGELESLSIRPSFEATFKSLHYLYLLADYQIENFRDTFYISKDVYVPPGKYVFTDATVDYMTPYWENFTGEIMFTTGQFYDGWYYLTYMNPTVKLAGKWELALTYRRSDVFFKIRGQSLTTHLAGLRMTYMHNTRWTASSYLQYNSLAGQIIWNARLRYNPREGIDFYVVYNDFINTNRGQTVPILPFSQQRTLLLKLTYTLRVR